MDGFAWNLLLAAAGVALIHTLLGPDHYLPFVALARARGWTPRRAMGVAAACGGAHVLSSLLLGALILLGGRRFASVDALQALRGEWAAWGLVAFGIAYGLWGLRRAVRRGGGLRPHHHGEHLHLHLGGSRPHGHSHRRDTPWTFWALLLVFVVGPCEPLIPLLLMPSSRGRWALTAGTALLFALVTVATMVLLVRLALAGSARWSLPAGLQRFRHALAGVIVTCCGLAVLFLGL